MSTNNTSQPQTEPKEIDLINVTGKMFTGIGRGFVGFGKQLLRFVRFTKKHFWFLLIFAVLGVGAGLVREHLQEPFFESEMLIKTQIAPSELIANQLNNLNLLIGENSIVALSTTLDISIENAEGLILVRANHMEEERVITLLPRANELSSQRDTIIEEFVNIRVRAREFTDLVHLDQAFTQFIENIPFVRERLNVFKNNNLLMQEAIEVEIEHLRDFQRLNLERGPQTTNSRNAPFLIQSEEQTYTFEILTLQRDLLDLQRNLALIRPATIIQPFLISETPVDSTLRNVMLLFLLFSTMGYIVLLIRKNWKHL